MNYYPLAEHKTFKFHFKFKIPIDSIMAIKSGEFRKPKKGEWFLSGSPIEAYEAYNDLDTKYHIAKIVRTEKTITYKILGEL